jgi:hypothetical protein
MLAPSTLATKVEKLFPHSSFAEQTRAGRSGEACSVFSHKEFQCLRNTFALTVPQREITVLAFVLFCILVVLLVLRIRK